LRIKGNISIKFDISTIKYDNDIPIVGIYKITSPIGRIYVGQSSDLIRRLIEYKKLKCKNQPRLYFSFQKHGVENHIFELIHTCEVNELNELEIHYINLFNCFNTENGLNLKEGGICGGKLSDETKRKLSDSRKGEKHHYFGKKLSKEHKNKMSVSHSGEKNHNYGKKFSDERKKQMSESRKGKNNPNYGKKLTAKQKEDLSKMKLGIKNPFFGKTHTKDVIESFKNRVVSKDTRDKMSKSRIGKKNPFYGKKHSEETKKMMIESRKRIRQERLTMIF